MIPVEMLNYWLSLGVVAMEIVTAAFLVLYFFRTKVTDLKNTVQLISDWGLWIGLFVTTSGVFFTLYYSEVLGIIPCGLCWLQRIGLYPQPLLFAIALWKQRSDADKRVYRDAADYSIAFSVFGGIVALYQHYLQMGGESVLPCPATSDQALDCGVRFVFEFGYVTFPFMAVSLFAFLVVLMLFVRKRV